MSADGRAASPGAIRKRRHREKGRPIGFVMMDQQAIAALDAMTRAGLSQREAIETALVLLAGLRCGETAAAAMLG